MRHGYAQAGALTVAWLVVAIPGMPAAGSGTMLGAEPTSGWTCVPLGRECTFDSDCCAKNCVSDPKLGKVCKPKDASWTCAPQGRKCTFDSDCCSKNCVGDPRLGKVCKPGDDTSRGERGAAPQSAANLRSIASM